MIGALKTVLLVAIATAAGLACSELLYRSPAARGVMAGALGRGELVAIVDGAGVYDSGDADAAELIVEANLRRAAHV